MHQLATRSCQFATRKILHRFDASKHSVSYARRWLAYLRTGNHKPLCVQSWGPAHPDSEVSLANYCNGGLYEDIHVACVPRFPQVDHWIACILSRFAMLTCRTPPAFFTRADETDRSTNGLLL